MNAIQALEHNQKIEAQIYELRKKKVTRYRVRVVERFEGGRRGILEELTTDYMTPDNAKTMYASYRVQYPDMNKVLIVIEEVEDTKRQVQVRLPVRDDSERDPIGPDPVQFDDSFAQV